MKRRMVGTWWRGQGPLVTSCQSSLRAPWTPGAAPSRSPRRSDSPSGPQLTLKQALLSAAGFSSFQRPRGSPDLLPEPGELILAPAGQRNVPGAWVWVFKGPEPGSHSPGGGPLQSPPPCPSPVKKRPTATVRHTLLVARVSGSTDISHYTSGDAAGCLPAAVSFLCPAPSHLHGPLPSPPTHQGPDPRPGCTQGPESCRGPGVSFTASPAPLGCSAPGRRAPSSPGQ